MDITNEAIQTTETKYKMRKLTALDIAPLAAILNKIGVKEFAGSFQSPEIQKAMNAGDADKVAEQVGMLVIFDMAGIVLDNLPNCMDDLFAFLADITETTKEEMQGLDMDVFIELLVELFKKNEFAMVFKLASKLLA